MEPREEEDVAAIAPAEVPAAPVSTGSAIRIYVGNLPKQSPLCTVSYIFSLACDPTQPLCLIDSPYTAAKRLFAGREYPQRFQQIWHSVN